MSKPDIAKRKEDSSSKDEYEKLRKESKLDKEKEDSSAFYTFCYRLLSDKIQFLFPRFVHLEKKLKMAGMNVYYQAFVCTLVFISVISGIAGVVIGFVITLMVTINPPEFEMLLPFIVGAAASQGIFGFMFYFPSLQLKSRRSRIVQELPYYIGYMATLASSGLTLEDVFKALSKEESDEEIVKDARIMVRNLEILGMDVLSSLRDMIERSPADPYTELLEGLTSTVEGGGNMKDYFISTAKVQLEEKKLMLKKMTSSLGMVAEMYTILLIVFPLLASIILSIMAIMTPNLGGFSLTTLMKVLTYGFVPFLGMLMLLMIDAMVPKR